MYKRKPNLSHVRVFGCVAYMKSAGNHLGKLENRSKKVVNLGKKPGTKGYHLYDPESDRIWVIHDVSFKESEFWPWNESGIEANQGVQFPIMGELTAQDQTYDKDRVKKVLTREH